MYKSALKCTWDAYIVCRKSAAAFHGAFHHVAHVGSHDGLHHLAGSLELLEELVDLREAGAGTVGDSLAAAAVDAVRVLTFLRGH